MIYCVHCSEPIVATESELAPYVHPHSRTAYCRYPTDDFDRLFCTQATPDMRGVTPENIHDLAPHPAKLPFLTIN